MGRTKASRRYSSPDPHMPITPIKFPPKVTPARPDITSAPAINDLLSGPDASISSLNTTFSDLSHSLTFSDGDSDRNVSTSPRSQSKVKLSKNICLKADLDDSLAHLLEWDECENLRTGW
ncbi:unnamed protein product [Protopolystoma xenopodis]|uniref:Uncharacterized protein n=1 Tax=Protopolystoma xenopodis TaxID=117903 RepID=A0A3S5BCM2_9PLAT|nr:unnamed protein product [Protopolystoma xenopodis]